MSNGKSKEISLEDLMIKKKAQWEAERHNQVQEDFWQANERRHQAHKDFWEENARHWRYIFLSISIAMAAYFTVRSMGY